MHHFRIGLPIKIESNDLKKQYGEKKKPQRNSFKHVVCTCHSLAASSQNMVKTQTVLSWLRRSQFQLKALEAAHFRNTTGPLNSML